jgi:Brp/Blh family beta-carotene 15,15'-monooxygenase
MLQYILSASFRKVKRYSLLAAFTSLGILQLVGESGKLLYFIIHVFTLGIAHGALDRWLFNLSNPTQSIKKTTFYGSYIVVMAIVAGIWWISPTVALGIFILYSAWHFGEVEWTHIMLKKKFVQQIYSGAWGLLLFASMFLFNAGETLEVITRITPISMEIPKTTMSLNIAVTVVWLLYSSLPILLGWTLKENFLVQIFNVLVLTLLFFALDLATSFAVFFFYFHSIPSLTFELKAIDKGNIKPVSYNDVFKEMLVLSVAPILAIIAITLFFDQSMFNTLLPVLVVMGSAISFPHTIIYSKATQEY